MVSPSCRFVPVASVLFFASGLPLSSALATETAVSAATPSVSAASATEATSAAAATLPAPRVIVLTEAQLPKGKDAETRKAEDLARDQALRAKCKAIPKDTYDKYLCERRTQVDLVIQLEALRKQLEGQTPRWPVDVAAQQHQWEARRDACRQDQDVKMCLELAYMERIGQLQTQFGLVAADGPIQYQCGDQVLQLTYHATNPPLVEVVKGEQHRLAWMRPTDNGVDYHGDVTVHEYRGGADITWDQQTLQCRQR